LIWGGGGTETPDYIVSARKNFQPVKAKQLHNNIKSEQKGNKMLFVFHFHYFVVK
jgi:hypothetical protein